MSVSPSFLPLPLQEVEGGRKRDGTFPGFLWFLREAWSWETGRLRQWYQPPSGCWLCRCHEPECGAAMLLPRPRGRPGSGTSRCGGCCLILNQEGVPEPRGPVAASWSSALLVFASCAVQFQKSFLEGDPPGLPTVQWLDILILPAANSGLIQDERQMVLTQHTEL